MQLELIKFIASYKPLIAAIKVSERTDTIVKRVLLSSMPAQVWLQILSYFLFLCLPASSSVQSRNDGFDLLWLKELAVMESMESALDNVVSAIFDGSNEIGGGSSEVQLALCRIFEGFFFFQFFRSFPHPTPLYCIPYECFRHLIVRILKGDGFLS